ncbi:MAG: PorT family protein [Methanobacteriota archaeon]|nr:MAG: PorT family protein [Euryarchaeota archaeon]
MKRSFLSFCLVLIFGSSLVHAKDSNQYGFKFGVGFSSASITDESNQLNRNEFTYRIGPNFGVFMYWFHHNNFQLYSELEYQARGSKERIQVIVEPDMPTNLFVTQDNLFEYLSFSSGIQLTPFNEKLPLFINTGFSLNYLLRNDSGFGELNFDIHRLVLSWEIGAGVVLTKLKSGKVFVSINYEPDITNAVVNDNALPAEIRVKHHLLSVAVGLLLP